MMRHLLLAATAAVALASSVFSPWLMLVFALQGIWYPGFLPLSLNVMFALSVLLLALAHLLVAGVVAALFEHATARQEATVAGRAVWLLAALALAIPSLLKTLEN
jgi:hypothetical protein